MLKLSRPLVILDVETTGVHPQVDRVVQVGLCKMRPNGPTTEWQTLVNPGVSIPPEASAVHHITDEMVAGAPTFKAVAPVLAAGLKDADVGGFNVRFDLQFLIKEFERVGGRNVLEGAKIVDVFRIFKQMYPRDLSAAVKEYLGVELAGAHDALTDARATMQVLEAQMERHRDALPETVPELHKLFFESPADGFLDVDGKLAWRHGKATLNFGKHPTVPLDEADPGYLRWIVNSSDLSPEVKRIVAEALKGNYPKKEGVL